MPDVNPKPSAAAMRRSENRWLGLPPIIFPGRPERWWGDETLKAETDAPQATLEQRHQAAGDILAVRCRGFFSAGALFSGAPHARGDPPKESPSKRPRKSRSSRSVRSIWLASRWNPRVL